MFPLPGVQLKYNVGTPLGVFCNWESALAHAASGGASQSFTEKYITQKVGVLPNVAPHFCEMWTFGGWMSESNYIDDCETERGELDAVLSVNGVEESITLDSVDGSFFPRWRFLEVVYSNPDFEIVTLTEHNVDCFAIVMAKRSLLEPWRREQRYLDLTMTEWKQLSEEKYKFCELQEELNKYDALVSKDAVLPKSLMKGMKLPGKSGKAIADFARRMEVDPSGAPARGPV